MKLEYKYYINTVIIIMPYYKDKNILFIHIPKTGGSVIEKELEKTSKVSWTKTS